MSFESRKRIAEKYLGDTSPLDFDSWNEILAYFDRENVKAMFPNEELDAEEIDIACSFTLSQWHS